MTEKRADINYYLCERSGGGWRILGRYGDFNDAKRAARSHFPGKLHYHWTRHDELGCSYDTTARGLVMVLDAMGIHRARDKWGVEDSGSGYIPEWSPAAITEPAEEE